MGVKVFYKSKLLWFFPKWVDAVTLGQCIFVRAATATDKLLDHEKVHCAQYKQHGIFGFLWIYFIREWGVPYRQKSFEKEAYGNKT